MTLRTFGVATALILSCAAMANAQVANGQFQLGGCGDGPTDGQVELTNNVLTFHESVCTLANPVPIQGTDGYSYVGNCAGEGTEWQANMMLIPLEGGQIMRILNNGTVTDYDRCTS